ncbi:MAG: hypothetical protein GEEBNDBF_02005 [bacterium]|nr:hypothetical protein [bacterium]
MRPWPLAMLVLLLVLSGLAACQQPPAPPASGGVVQIPLAEMPPAAAPPTMDRIPLSSPPEPETPVTPPQVAPEPPAASPPPQVATPPAEPPATAAAPTTEPEPPSEPDAASSTPPEVPESPATSVEDPPTATPPPAPAPVPAPLLVSYDEERAAYLRKFNAAIERHKQYPPQSRRLGRQGRVALLIGINAEGELERLEVASSSGHLALDNAALEAVRAAAPFPPPPQPAFDPHPLFQLGLEFRLQ